MLAYVLINVVKGEEEKVFAKLRQKPQVKSAATLYGPYDGVIVVEANDVGSLNQFILEEIRSVAEINMTSTMIVAKEY